MRFRATWPIEDPTLNDAALIALAEADLPNVRPEGYSLRDLRWSIEGGHVCLIADARGVKRRANAECGTNSGYYRHKRTTKTEPCEPCRKAHRAYEAQWQASKREQAPKPPRGSRSNQPPRVPCLDCGTTTRAIHGRCRPCKEAHEGEVADIPPTWIRKGLIWVAAPVESGSVDRDSEAA